MTFAINPLVLECAATRVTIAPHRGAIVTSFCVEDRELLYLDEATFNDRSKNVRGGIPILFPAPGKLDGDRWRCAGKAGELKQHGFARNVAWQIEATSAARATLSLRSTEDTRRSYPWDFAAELSYAVTPRTLTIEFAVRNLSETHMPFAFGVHPYFLVHDKAAARIPTRATRAFDNVAKSLLPFTGFDLMRDEVDLHLIDHGSTHGELVLPDGVIAIDTSPEFIRWVVWTLANKEYVCLEPWTAPGNALNTGEGVIALAPGQRHALWTKISCERSSGASSAN